MQATFLIRPEANRTFHQRAYVNINSLAAGELEITWDPSQPTVIQAAPTNFTIEGVGFGSLPDCKPLPGVNAFLVGLLLGANVNRFQIFDDDDTPREDIRNDPGVLCVSLDTKYMKFKLTNEARIYRDEMLFELVWVVM